jgi:hypothetical protein
MTSAVQVSLDEYLASTYEPDREYVMASSWNEI